MKTKPYPSFKMAPLAATSALVLGGLIAARPAQAKLFEFSEQDEIKAGQQVAAQAQQQYGRALPASDPRAQRVRRIGMQFARLSTRKNIPFSYTVLQNEKVLNAFAAPGGPIFVTTKLLETTSNDAELAYVLGHETGHIQERHIAKTVAKQQKVALGAGILGAILGRGKNGNIVGAATNLAFTTWNAGYSRDHERDADVYGIQQMAKLGYDPRAAVSMLGKLGDGPDNPIQKALADHPSSKSRQDLARQTIQKDNLLEIARKAGGPRLSLASGADGGSPSYANYPSDDATYPNTANTGSANGNNANSGNLQLRTVSVGGRNVILAPVAGFARWAGANIDDGDARDSVVLSRGDNTIQLRPNSPFADVNGRSVVMATKAQVFDGQLYAPVGNLADGTGTKARYDGDRNALVLSQGRNQDVTLLLPNA